jgi:pimeloyl-ACP methyl ester carboxylesterase
MKRLSGLRALVHDAVDAVVNLVEESHQATAHKPLELLGAVPTVGDGARVVGALHDGIAKTVYASVRLVNRGVEAVGDLAATAIQRSSLPQALRDKALARLEEKKIHDELAFWSDSAQSALNAWAGDFLARRNNPLAIPLEFFVNGAPVACTREAFAAALPHATGKLCVFIHGLGCTEASWRFRAHEQFGDKDANYGSFLARDLGYTPLYVRYNTGLHISQNGRALAELMEQLCEVYPCPLEEIALVGHSMGGLVARSAAHYAHLEGRRWLTHLTHVLCIGSPHLGAALEQVTHKLAHLLMRFDTPGTQVPAKLLNTRSAGIKDLRFGYVLDEDWTGKDPDRSLTDERHDVPMIPTVTYGFVAATFLRDPDHPLGHLLGDLLVRVPSASGRCPEARHVRFDIGEVVHGVHHLAMLNHPQVYAQVRKFLASRVIEVEGEDVTRGAPLLRADAASEDSGA